MFSGELAVLGALERKVLRIGIWMIYHANFLRQDCNGLKAGGNQASCASMVSLMTALYFRLLPPEDRVAVKPRASPVFHAIRYLLGNQSRDNLLNFRGFGGARSYPGRTRDRDDVDFSTGSVGLGAGITAFASMVRDFARARPDRRAANRPGGRMVALMGDAEMDEGNVFEAMREGWKHDLRRCWWIVDYNRQSLDGIVVEGLPPRLKDIFGAFDWDVVEIKYGALQRAAFSEPGGEALRRWIDQCPNATYSALLFKGGQAWREKLESDLGQEVAPVLSTRDDLALSELVANLGGHCLETPCETFQCIGHDRPTAFVPDSVKGWRHLSQPSPKNWRSPWNGLSTTCNVTAMPQRASARGCATRPVVRSIFACLRAGSSSRSYARAPSFAKASSMVHTGGANPDPAVIW